jgi:diaminopimelate epimerase
MTGAIVRKLHFYKMSGSGNDFVIVDNFDGKHDFNFFKGITQKVCNRNNGVGADGLIIFNREQGVDFRWDFFNSDGSIAEMCGNGARCAARLFSKLHGKKEITFMTLAGIIDAEAKNDIVKVRLSKPSSFVPKIEIYVDGEVIKGSFVNTGVPHFVMIPEDVDDISVRELGRKIRFHEQFSPAGTNVNFVKHLGGSSIKVRTYERGVEDETLACGTGACASALVCGRSGLVKSPVTVVTSGGEDLVVHYEVAGDDFDNVYLEGKVRLICEGEVFLSEL